MEDGNRDTRIFALLTVAGCFLYAIGSSVRGSYGILLSAIAGNAGLDYADVSFVIAFSQLMYGIMQPVFGAFAVRTSDRTALLSGVVLMLAGLASTPLCTAVWQLVLCFGIVLASGTAAFTFGIIMSVLTPRLTSRQAAIASGFVSAGVGLSPAVFSPLMHALVSHGGLANALGFLCIPTVAMVPAIWLACRGARGAAEQPSAAEPGARMPDKGGAPGLIRGAFARGTYVAVTVGFFTCGFHMSLIETHIFSNMKFFDIPGDVAAWVFSTYGLSTIAGAVLSGYLCNRMSMGRLLGCLYGSRCFIIVLLLCMPKTVWTFLAVIIMLGMTGVATVAPTSGLISRAFGPKALGILFGFAYLVHQVGSFTGSWLGGVTVQLTGSYTFIWCCSIVLSFVASFFCLFRMDDRA